MVLLFLVFPEKDWDELPLAFHIILIQMQIYMLISSFLQMGDQFMGRTLEIL